MGDIDDHRLMIWGAGGHAKTVYDAVVASGQWNPVGLFVDPPFAPPATPRPVRVHLAADPIEFLNSLGIRHVFVAMGDNQARLSRTIRLQEAGFNLPVIVHPAAIVSPSANLGPATFVGPGAVVNADTGLGRGVIINSGAIVEHDCRVGDGAHVAPGAVLGGHVEIGREALIGLGSRIAPRIKVGERGIVGAGAVVIRDVAPETVVAGVPARAIQEKG